MEVWGSKGSRRWLCASEVGVEKDKTLMGWLGKGVLQRSKRSLVEMVKRNVIGGAGRRGSDRLDQAKAI